MRPLLEVLIEKAFGRITIDRTNAFVEGIGYTPVYIIEDTDEVNIGQDQLLERAIEQAYDFVCKREEEAEEE